MAFQSCGQRQVDQAVYAFDVLKVSFVNRSSFRLRLQLWCQRTLALIVLAVATDKDVGGCVKLIRTAVSRESLVGLGNFR
jgi:hypothetical protein